MIKSHSKEIEIQFSQCTCDLWIYLLLFSNENTRDLRIYLHLLFFIYLFAFSSICFYWANTICYYQQIDLVTRDWARLMCLRSARIKHVTFVSICFYFSMKNCIYMFLLSKYNLLLPANCTAGILSD